VPKTGEPESAETLREPTYFILLSLAAGDRNRALAKHGYAIIKDVETLSAGRVRLSTSTLYEALARLLEQGLIERVDDPDPATESGERPEGHHPGKPRKAYRLAYSGRRALEAEVSRLENLVSAARRQLSGGHSEGG
jgi:DNA-binding PadR family transcriptional regulator